MNRCVHVRPIDRQKIKEWCWKNEKDWMWIMGKCSMDAFPVLKSFQHSSQIICRCVPREPAQKHAYDWKFKTAIKIYKEIETEITTGNNNNNKQTVGQKFVLFRIQHWNKSIESEMLILAEKNSHSHALVINWKSNSNQYPCCCPYLFAQILSARNPIKKYYYPIPWMVTMLYSIFTKIRRKRER